MSGIGGPRLGGHGQPGSLGTVFHPERDLPGDGTRPPPPGAVLRGLPRRRRPGMIALAMALIGAGVLGSAAIYSGENREVPVLLVTAPVAAGSVVTGSDVGTADVAVGPGVRTIPARQLSQVLGLTAATALRPGTLLAASELTTAQPPLPGQLLVPVAVRPSVLPAGGLAPGDRVLVVATPATIGDAGSGGGTGSAPVLTGSVPALVQAVNAVPNADGLDVVDLLVAAPNGVPLAQQAATGQIALLVTSRSS